MNTVINIWKKVRNLVNDLIKRIVTVVVNPVTSQINDHLDVMERGE